MIALKVWIDHNTLYKCQNGLIDVTRGSTDVTISNNWFRNQDKIKLLGHDDGYIRDKNMKMTIAYNHFGRNCNQRMPRYMSCYTLISHTDVELLHINFFFKSSSFLTWYQNQCPKFDSYYAQTLSNLFISLFFSSNIFYPSMIFWLNS